MSYSDGDLDAPEPDTRSRARREHVGEVEATVEVDFISSLKAIAEQEAKRFDDVPCRGDLALISACSAECAVSCMERAHPTCPRQRVERADALERRRRWEQRKRLKDLGVGELVLSAVFDRPPWDTDAVRKMRAGFAEPHQPVLVFLQGGVGCGKGCAAALWAAENEAHWITARQLARMGYESTLDRLGAEPLVLDDLGMEFVDEKGFFLSTLDGLIDAHVAARVPMLVTTNVAAKDFAARYQARIASRIRESGAFMRVEGGDLRRRVK